MTSAPPESLLSVVTAVVIITSTPWLNVSHECMLYILFHVFEANSNCFCFLNRVRITAVTNPDIRQSLEGETLHLLLDDIPIMREFSRRVHLNNYAAIIWHQPQTHVYRHSDSERCIDLY